MKACSVCDKKNAKLQCGNECGFVYCGDQCADAHWEKGHWMECIRGGMKRERGREDDDVIVLVSHEGDRVQLTVKQLSLSDTISQLLEDTNENEVPVPNIRTPILNLIAEYLKIESVGPPTQEDEDKARKFLIKQRINLSSAIETALAAHYLGITGGFMEEMGKTIVTQAHINFGHSPQDILKTAGITSEFSRTESKAVQHANERGSPYDMPIINAPSRPFHVGETPLLTHLTKDIIREYILPLLSLKRCDIFRKSNVRFWSVTTAYMLKQSRKRYRLLNNVPDAILLEAAIAFDGSSIFEGNVRDVFLLTSKDMENVESVNFGNTVGYKTKSTVSVAILKWGSLQAIETERLKH